MGAFSCLELDSHHEQANRHPWPVVFMAPRPGHLPGPGQAIQADRGAPVPSWPATEGRTHGRVLHSPADRCGGGQAGLHGPCLNRFWEVCTLSDSAFVRVFVGLAVQRVHRVHRVRKCAPWPGGNVTRWPQSKTPAWGDGGERARDMGFPRPQCRAVQWAAPVPKAAPGLNLRTFLRTFRTFEKIERPT